MFLSLVPPGAPPRPANLSRAYDYWMRSCVRANPAYKIVLWTRDDCDRLIATRHPKYAQFYNETLGAMGVIRQADFCRVAVLATHGGVYLDFDQSSACDLPRDAHTSFRPTRRLCAKKSNQRDEPAIQHGRQAEPHGCVTPSVDRRARMRTRVNSIRGGVPIEI